MLHRPVEVTRGKRTSKLVNFVKILGIFLNVRFPLKRTLEPAKSTKIKVRFRPEADVVSPRRKLRGGCLEPSQLPNHQLSLVMQRHRLASGVSHKMEAAIDSYGIRAPGNVPEFAASITLYVDRFLVRPVQAGAVT